MIKHCRCQHLLVLLSSFGDKLSAMICANTIQSDCTQSFSRRRAYDFLERLKGKVKKKRAKTKSLFWRKWLVLFEKFLVQSNSPFGDFLFASFETTSLLISFSITVGIDIFAHKINPFAKIAVQQRVNMSSTMECRLYLSIIVLFIVRRFWQLSDAFWRFWKNPT